MNNRVTTLAKLETKNTGNDQILAKLERLEQKIRSLEESNSRLEANNQLITRSMEKIVVLIPNISKTIDEHKIKVPKLLEDVNKLTAHVEYLKVHARSANELHDWMVVESMKDSIEDTGPIPKQQQRVGAEIPRPPRSLGRFAPSLASGTQDFLR